MRKELAGKVDFPVQIADMDGENIQTAWKDEKARREKEKTSQGAIESPEGLLTRMIGAEHLVAKPELRSVPVKVFEMVHNLQGL